MFRRTLAVLFLAVFLLPSQGSAQERSEAEVQSWKALLASFDGVEPIDLITALVADTPENDPPPAMLAHLMYISQHFDIAAFYFHTDYRQNHDHIESLSNLAGLLVELNANDPDAYPTSFLNWAVEIAQKAAEAAPQNAGVQNTLSFVLQAAARNYLGTRPEFADSLLERASAASAFATKNAPDRPVFWSNLARLERLQNNPGAARRALDRAAGADPQSPVAFLTANAIGVPLPRPQSDQTTRQCNVDFKCAEICPKSIIGQVNFVSCKLENATQQDNCTAGKPYATAFDCEEDFPVFGAVPGLSNVASVCVPGVCFHLRVKGNGDVDIRVEGGPHLGPIKVVVGADAHYSNKNGFSVDRFSGGVKFSLYNKSPAGNLSGKASEINPVEVKIGSVDGKPVTLNGTVMGRGLIEYQ